MNYEHSARTHVGRQRERNEDSLVAQVVNGRFIGVVADGMGGHQAGETASRLATEAIQSVAADLSETEMVTEVLVAAVRSANQRIHEAGSQDEQLAGMGTTLTGAVVELGRVWLVHVGDSRAYLLRGGQIAQLTADDSLVEELVRRGHLSETEALSHPQRNLLLRALGVAPTVEVGSQEETLLAGDVLLLCSDGLTNMVPDRQIADIVNGAKTLERAAEELIKAANERGGYDNITVVLVRCPDGRAGEPESRDHGSRLTDHASRITPHAPLPLGGSWRPLVWGLAGAGLVVVLLWGGLRLGRAYLDRQYYLGESNGQVVLYQGLPRELAGHRFYWFFQKMDVSAEQVMASYRERLQEGIVVGSPDEAVTHLQEILKPDAENGTASDPL